MALKFCIGSFLVNLSTNIHQMKITRLLSFFIASILLSSCAAIIYGSKQDVQVTSNPSGARVYLNGKDTELITPCVVKFKRLQPKTESNRKNEAVFTFKKESFHEEVYRDLSRFNPVAIIDLLMMMYIVPPVVDFVTGATRIYSNFVSVNLRPETISPEKKESSITKNFYPRQQYFFERKSDVDNGIPILKPSNSFRFALIIGNEDYSSKQPDLSSEINVDFARNDAYAFRDYAQNILGVPEQNTIFLLDGTFGQMSQAISKMELIIKNTQGKAELFVYYAGHGLPDEKTKKPYLMPVDISGNNPYLGISVNSMYSRLTKYPSKRVTVFLDACFSGGSRNQGLFTARGVKIKPNDEILRGNLIVFSASSGTQSSLPYTEQRHGLFTYFLLKKMKETSGNISYGELGDYLEEKVSLQSILVNSKEQIPQVGVSQSLMEDWKTFHLR
jgi:Caspase domain